jgi:tRNA threonylcarbamoyl adenosine modification protein (Sua5/YciO/YrdC/YwlC family)
LIRLREVAQASREGKIVAFPTETVYGMGAAMSAVGVREQLVQLKKRDEGKPFSYHIGEWDMVDFLKVRRTPAFRFLTRQFWPGPLTVIILNEQGKKIGLRFPRHRLAIALINSAGEPFIATSANISDSPSPRTAEEVMNQMGGQIDYLIDGGRAEYAEDSTVVDLTAESPAILRRGALVGRVDAKAHRREGVFELKALILEPGVRVSERFTRDIAQAVVRCARWHGCPAVIVTETEPAGFAAALVPKTFFPSIIS